MLEQTSADGRTARGQRARAAAIDAYLDLLTAGIAQPTAAAVAARAGCSVRLVFHHFADLDRLFAEAADRQMERVAPLIRRVSAELPCAAKIGEFVKTRAQVFDTISPVRRAAIRHEPFSKEIQQRLRAAHALARDGARRVFAPQLAAFRPAERREVLAALIAATSWESWECLRHRQGLSQSAARRALERTIRALLATPHRVGRETAKETS